MNVTVLGGQNWYDAVGNNTPHIAYRTATHKRQHASTLAGEACRSFLEASAIKPPGTCCHCPISSRIRRLLRGRLVLTALSQHPKNELAALANPTQGPKQGLLRKQWETFQRGPRSQYPHFAYQRPSACSKPTAILRQEPFRFPAGLSPFVNFLVCRPSFSASSGGFK